MEMEKKKIEKGGVGCKKGGMLWSCPQVPVEGTMPLVSPETMLKDLKLMAIFICISID